MSDISPTRQAQEQQIAVDRKAVEQPFDHEDSDHRIEDGILPRRTADPHLAWWFSEAGSTGREDGDGFSFRAGTQPRRSQSRRG